VLFGLVVSALFVKMMVIPFIQGYYRSRYNVFAKPEDANCYGDGEVADEELPIVDRAQRTLRNDLENIPIFLFLFWSGVTLDVSSFSLQLYGVIFVSARIAHTATYLKPVQPYRTIAYAVGLFTSIALSGHVVFLSI
jgi:uncharacterized MAPEG superfamily protein